MISIANASPLFMLSATGIVGTASFLNTDSSLWFCVTSIDTVGAAGNPGAAFALSLVTSSAQLQIGVMNGVLAENFPYRGWIACPAGEGVLITVSAPGVFDCSMFGVTIPAPS